MPRSVDPTGEEAQRLVTRFGPMEINWPGLIAYFGGLTLAVASDVISPPVGMFIAALPVGMLFRAPSRAWPIRIVTGGATTAVSGNPDGTVRAARRRRSNRSVRRAAQRQRLGKRTA